MVFKGCISNTQEQCQQKEREKIKHRGEHASMFKTLNIFLVINFISLWSTLNTTYV